MQQSYDKGYNVHYLKRAIKKKLMHFDFFTSDNSYSGQNIHWELDSYTYELNGIFAELEWEGLHVLEGLEDLGEPEATGRESGRKTGTELSHVNAIL